MADDQIVTPPSGGEFGSSTDIQGNTAVIGNQHFSGPGRQIQGVVYILERGPAGWQVVKTLLPPATGDLFTRFGAQVTIAGNRLAVGDMHFGDNDVAGGHTGRVYVYEKQGATWPDQPAYVIEPSQPNVFSFGQVHAFSGEYLAATELVSLNLSEPDLMMVRVKTYRLQNGQATLLGQVERRGGDYFGFEMSMYGSELAILNAHKGMLRPPTEGTVTLYDLSGGTMRQAAAVPVPMAKGDFFSTPKVRLEGDRLLVWKSTPPGAGGIFFKRTVAGWRVASEIRPPQRGELSEYLMDVAGDALVVTGNLGTSLYTASAPHRFLRTLNMGSPYGLAISQDTAMIVRSNQVVFASLRSLVASDTVVVDPSQAGVPGGGVYLGELVAGQECKVEVELQNASPGPLQLTGVQITPVTGANSLTGHSFTPVILPPLGKTRVHLTLNPPSAGSYRLSLEVQHPDAAQVSFVYRVDFEARAADFEPFVSESGGSVLAAKGEPVKLQADATGPRGRFNCQWYKDGRALAGSTQPFLYIPSAQPAHAGRYRLDVWAAGSPRMSCAMALGVYERQASSVIASIGESLSFTARFWGPGIRVKWVSGYDTSQPFAQTWALQGTETATLSILSPMALAATGPARISAGLVMGEGATATCNDHVVEVRRVPVIDVTGVRYGRVGQDFSPLILSDLTEYHEPAVFSAERLPPGLRFTNNGYRIGGTPTQAGSYRVKIMAENRHGQAVPFILNLRIFAAGEQPIFPLYFGTPLRTAGILMVPESTPEIPPWPALVQVQSTTGTGFSGSLAFGAVRRPFAGQWTLRADEGVRSATVRLAPFLEYRSVVLHLTQSPVEESFPSSGIEARLLLESSSPEAGPAEVTTWLEPLYPLGREWSQAFAGRYSFLMGGLAGQGFGSFTIGSDFQANGAGTLADGSPFTFSMPMVRGENGPWSGKVMLVRLGSGLVRLWGQLNTMATGFEEAGKVNGSLTMARPGKEGARLMPEGYNTEVPVRGARYFVPKGVPLFTPPEAVAEQVGRTPISLIADGLPESVYTNLTFTKAGKVIVDRPNPWDLKMDVYLPTGFFSGSFKVNEPVPGTESRFVRRAVNFSGMIIPALRVGGGFFHFSPLPNRLAEPPTTSATTPIYIGGVTLE